MRYKIKISGGVVGQVVEMGMADEGGRGDGLGP
jgi:hypothetical protein